MLNASLAQGCPAPPTKKAAGHETIMLALFPPPPSKGGPECGLDGLYMLTIYTTGFDDQWKLESEDANLDHTPTGVSVSLDHDLQT